MRFSVLLMILLTTSIQLTGQERGISPLSEEMPGKVIFDTTLQRGLYLKSQPQSYYSLKKLLFTGMAERLDSIIGMTLPPLPGNNHLMSKQVYQYNLLQLNTSETGYLWDALLQQWTPNQKLEYTYYQNNRHYLSSMISSIWDSTGQSWFNQYGYEYDYDGALQLTRITYLGDSMGTGILDPYHKVELLYTGSPLRHTQSYVYMRNWSGSWDLSQKVDIVYDGTSNRILLENNRYWIDSTSSWTPVYHKTEYTYNPDYSMNSRITYYYNSVSAQFDPMYGDQYFYNSGGKINGRIYSKSDYSMPQYLPSIKMERSFGMSGLVEWQKESLFNPWILQWNTGRISTYTRDTSNTSYTLLLPHWIESDTDLAVNVFGSRMLLETPHWEWDSLTSTMVNSSISKYYYSSQIISVDDAEKSQIKIFPNPVADWLIIDNPAAECYTIKIFDLQGREMLEKSSYGSARIDMTGLKNGIYLLRIHDSKSSTVLQGKVMVLR